MTTLAASPMPPLPFDPRDIRPFVTPSLRERILAKLAFRDDGCVYWTGAYNRTSQRTVRGQACRRPVIYLGGGTRGPIVYVAPLVLAMAAEGDLRPIDPTTGARLFACHTCATSNDGWYRCVAVDHLEWGTQSRNEQDKRREVPREQ